MLANSIIFRFLQYFFYTFRYFTQNFFKSNRKSKKLLGKIIIQYLIFIFRIMILKKKLLSVFVLFIYHIYCKFGDVLLKLSSFFLLFFVIYTPILSQALMDTQIHVRKLICSQVMFNINYGLSRRYRHDNDDGVRRVEKKNLGIFLPSVFSTHSLPASSFHGQFVVRMSRNKKKKPLREQQKNPSPWDYFLLF